MIAEALVYATARTSPSLRRFGHVGGAVALWSRATRCRRAWAPHQARCEAFVERAIADLPGGGTALVLGSGLTREIALPALAGRFDRVVLVDAVHLWPARRLARRCGAVIAVADLTGCAEWLLGRAEVRIDPLRALAGPDLRFVLSANLLSQMPIAAERWIERHSPTATRFPADLPERIVAWHLADILAPGARTCLLTDVCHRKVSRAGAVLDETDLMHGVRLPAPDESWDWEVAPPGEIDRGAAHIHRMHAYADLAAAMQREPFGSIPTP